MLLSTMGKMVMLTLRKEAWRTESRTIEDFHYSPLVYGMLEEHIANIVSSGHHSQE